MVNRFLSPLVIVYRGSKTTFMLCVYVLVYQGCCNKIQARVGIRAGVALNCKNSLTGLETRGQVKVTSGHLSLIVGTTGE